MMETQNSLLSVPFSIPVSVATVTSQARRLFLLLSCSWTLTLNTLLQVLLRMDDGLSLGLMIRGGAEYGLGIYITGVDPGSAADAEALKVSRSSHPQRPHVQDPCLQSDPAGFSIQLNKYFYLNVFDPFASYPSFRRCFKVKSTFSWCLPACGAKVIMQS